MAAQELRWLTYLLTDLGEQPRSPPVLYVDNKAMLALCREHRLEHRTKHIALRYFLVRCGDALFGSDDDESKLCNMTAWSIASGHCLSCHRDSLARCPGVGGVLSMKVGAVEELASGAVSVAVVADVVSAAVDVVSSCRIVANARILSASGMVCEYQNPPGLKSGSRSDGCVQEAKLTMASLSAVPRSGTKSRTKTLFFKTALTM
ncbi:unnamed protein product [Closterium sp. NIES-53]